MNGTEDVTPVMVRLDRIEGWLDELWEIAKNQDPRVNGTVERELEQAEGDAARRAVLDRYDFDHHIRVGQRMAISWLRTKMLNTGWIDR